MSVHKSYCNIYPILMVLLLNLSAISILQAQNPFNDRLYEAYIENEMCQWTKTMLLMEKEYMISGDYDMLHNLTLAQYGYINYCLAVKDFKKAAEYINLAEKNVDKLLRTNKYTADAYALKAALIGYEIGIKPFKVTYLAPQCMDNVEKALSINKNCVNGLIEKGNILFLMPEIIGGSKQGAIAYYENAIEIMENDSLKLSNNWMYLNSLILLARSYEQTGQFAMAKNTYEKILSYEQDFAWVKRDLYPGLLMKLDE